MTKKMNPAEALYRARDREGNVVYEGKPEMRYTFVKSKGKDTKEKAAAFHHDVPWAATLEAYDRARS